MKKYVCRGLQVTSLIWVILALSACGTTQKIMPPLRYNKPVDVHVSKKAYIHWDIGRHYAGKIPSNSGQSGVLEYDIIASMIDSSNRQRNPSQYTLSYGKAEQAIFITSLRDVLNQNDTFKDTELTTDVASVATKDVLINIYFKTARVSLPEKGHRITLSVEMTISSSGKAPFKRTYLVETDEAELGDTFINKQTKVSQRLLEKVIVGIEQWARHEGVVK